MEPLRALLTDLVDYAGLFPPSKLDMEPAVANYGAYLKGEQRWMLGRFVVPIGRLEELAAVVAEQGLMPLPGETPWRLSVLTGADAASVNTLLDFNRRYLGRLTITSAELKPATPEALTEALEILPEQLELFFEIATEPGFEAFIEALAASRGNAKIRTGGVTSEAFPRPGRVAAFLAACAEARVPFKATAGLHHPICGRYRLTYEEDSASAPMYGFLNLFLAAAMLYTGHLEPDEVVPLLLEGDARAFSVDDEVIAWHGHRITTAELTRARRRWCRSYGSCSFTEPVDDLRELSWL